MPEARVFGALTQLSVSPLGLCLLVPGVRPSLGAGSGSQLSAPSPFSRITREPFLGAGGWGLLPSDTLWSIDVSWSLPRCHSHSHCPFSSCPTLLPPAPPLMLLTQAQKGPACSVHAPPPPQWRPRFLWKRKSSSAHSPRNHKEGGGLTCSLPVPSINLIWMEADTCTEVQ